MKYSQFLVWLLSHLDSLPALLAFVQVLIGLKSTLPERAEALKGLIDVLLPLVGDFPSASVASVESDAALESKVLTSLANRPVAQGVEMAAWDGSRLRKIWEVLGPLLPILIGLIPK